MANKNLFQTVRGFFAPKTDAVNEAGGAAYQLSPKAALAQYAATGCFSQTFYADAAEQLDRVLALAAELDAEFVAKTAVYAREKGFMKDMPALLAAALSTKDKALFEKIFPRVVDNGKMLRVFVQIMRSGAVGRKSLGSLPKRLIREWFDARRADQIFKQSVGQSPSFADILKMVHPKPKTPEKEALYRWFLGREVERAQLPEIVRSLENFKAGETKSVPAVPFQMLTALPISTREWTEIARHAAWQMTRMNLNTFARHGVFDSAEMTEIVAARLRDREAIRKARVFPYQLLAAYAAAAGNSRIPRAIAEALQDAMEIATENVPAIDGKVYVFPDVSGSMHSPVTGHRRGATSAVRCIDVAALVAATFLRKNPTTEVIPFESNVVKVALNPRDSIMTNAQKLASLPCGGTNCSAPLRELNRHRSSGDLVVYVSDNESWIDTPFHGRFGGSGTETMKQWNEFKSRNPDAKLVCIDIQPYAHTQAKERADILNVGGFSDQVFTLIAEFAAGNLSADHWAGVIERVDI